MNGERDNRLTDEAVAALREAVKPYYTEKRYVHALGVEEEARYLGSLLLPRRMNELSAAALLHDITKKSDLKKQLQCLSEFGIIMPCPISPEVIHAVTGAIVAERDFPEYTDGEILDAIRYHTTGRAGMTMLESIIFLADYIEPGRTHEACTALRQEIHAELSAAETQGEREAVLNRGVIRAADNTITYLVARNALIDTDTVAARNYFLAKSAETETQQKGKDDE